MNNETTESAEFESSNLKSGLYFGDREQLYLQFTGGEKVYRYEDVPKDVWDDLTAAESAGTFFNQKIRGNYEYDELTSQE